MTCDVKCECGRLSGIASVAVQPKMKPQLAYRLVGEFMVIRQEPLCTHCRKPPLTTGEWKSEGTR